MNYLRILLSLILLIVTVYGQDLPDIAQTILPEIRRTGETGYLNCTVSRQGINKVFWIHKDTATTLTDDDKVDLEDKFNKFVDGGHRKYDVERHRIGDLTTYILIVRRLQLTDAGTYTCKIQVAGEQIHPSKDGQMVVLIPPAIQMTRTTQTLTRKEGENANLTCSATGHPKANITWMRPNGKRMPKPYENSFTVKGDVLQLKNLGKKDRGVYRCIADNAVRPPAMYDATLYVQFAPYAIAVQTTYGQAQNRLFDILLECRISGFPDPVLHWYKVVEGGLHPITDDQKHVLHVLMNHGEILSMFEFWFQLTIINVQANDYGEYICQGSNSFGYDRASVVLYETSECQGPYCIQGSDDVGSASYLMVHPMTVLLSLIWAIYCVTSL